MTILDNDVFIKELEKMFFNSRTGGAKNVAVTMKRYDGRTKPGENAELAKEPSVLFRAVHGHKKISTVVPPKEVNNFTIVYTQIMKDSMDNLERKPKKADDAKSAKKKDTKKKKASTTDSAKGTPTALKK